MPLAATSFSSQFMNLLLFLFCIAGASCIRSEETASFSAELIHRDSINSPFYDSKSTPSSSRVAAFRRSAARAKHIGRAITSSSSSSSNHIAAKTIHQSFSSPIINDDFEYLMSISIGTPARKILAIADTGSDLIWVQCDPCRDCYKHKFPLFRPNASSTYNKLSCRSNECLLLNKNSGSCDINSLCKYKYEYMDNSTVTGILSTETLSFNDGGVLLPEITFGCSHFSNGTFGEGGSGIVGLGGGNLSLVRQLGSAIGNKFSYCLPYPSAGNNSGISRSSRLYFGSKAVVSGPKTMSTPLIRGFPDTYYYLNLESISVLGNLISVKPAPEGKHRRGNIVIDSGTTLTYIDYEAMMSLADTVAKSVPLARVNDTISHIFDLCFAYNSTELLNTILLPEITFNFAGGAPVIIKPENAFVSLEDDKSICLVIVAREENDHVSIFGNLSQMNYRIGYDLDAWMLTFAPADCTANEPPIYRD